MCSCRIVASCSKWIIVTEEDHSQDSYPYSSVATENDKSKIRIYLKKRNVIRKNRADLDQFTPAFSGVCVTRGHVLIKDKFCTLLNSVQPIFCSLIQRPLFQQIQRKSCFNLRKDFTDVQQPHQICVMFTEFCKIKFDKFCLFRLHKTCLFSILLSRVNFRGFVRHFWGSLSPGRFCDTQFEIYGRCTDGI